MPNFLASRISRTSSMRPSSTSLRFGAFWVLIWLNLARCSMSRAVIGSPSTSTTTSCARPTAGTASKPAAATATALHSARIRICNITSCSPSTAGAVPARVFRLSPGPARITSPARINPIKSRQNLERGPDRRQGIRSQGTQAHLNHERIVLFRRRRPIIGVSGQPVQRQQETIVGIADANPRLVERMGVKIVAGRAEQYPVLRQLDRAAAEDALPPEQEAELRLRCVIAVEQLQRPAVEIGAAFRLETLDREGLLVEAAARGERVDRIRLIAPSPHVIDRGLVETAVQAGIGYIVDAGRERIRAEQLIRLAEHHVDGTGPVDLGRVLEADIGAAAAFDTIPTG